MHPMVDVPNFFTFVYMPGKIFSHFSWLNPMLNRPNAVRLSFIHISNYCDEESRTIIKNCKVYLNFTLSYKDTAGSDLQFPFPVFK
jgi:hypothetical protein